MTTTRATPTAAPREVRLADYRPPPFLVDRIDLDFDLAAAESLVTSNLVLRRAAGTPPDAPLVLDGTELELVDVAFEGRTLSANEYGFDEDGGLVLPASFFDRERGGAGTADPCAPFSLRVRTRVYPERNTGYKGLYASNGILCTQCEAEDFRRITFYPDRPDVLARFTTTLRGARDGFPVLLSNGNPVASGSTEDGRHWVRWEDPFPKPSYLFAVVAGDLACLESVHTTASGRDVQLRIYTEPHNVARCGHAMAALEKAMRWDEETYGLEYDLDLFMIVAVDHFNMGAMENKGLNIFNSRYVLADPETATDSDYANVETVISHEYFHNWTGNRVTCRDWFQLSLKEGLTVFRDQQFTAEMGSPAAKRIRDARFIRDHQFKEDSGPDAHPVRPDAYEAIDNFYTATVYFKGAEVIRMMHTLLGQEGFRRGMDRYFERHDGAAVTTDDFVAAMEDATGIDLGQFRRWYSQAGTPVLRIAREHDPQRRTLDLRVEQRIPEIPEGSPRGAYAHPACTRPPGPGGTSPPPRPRARPRRADRERRHPRARRPQAGRDLPTEGHPRAALASRCSAASPPPSRSRSSVRTRSSAPSSPAIPTPSHAGTRGQQLALARLDRLIAAGGAFADATSPADPPFVEALRSVLRDPAIDGAFAAALLTLPSEDYLAERMERIDVEVIHEARQSLRRALGEALSNEFDAVRRRLLAGGEPYRFDAEGAARRALANTCLAYLAATGSVAARAQCLAHFRSADNMTDATAALGALADLECEERKEALARFEERWRDDPLVMDKWFSLQATSALPGTLDRVTRLLSHPVFDLGNPNRVRALVYAFCFGNPVRFHAADGQGYRFWAERMREIDPRNPEVAARLAGAVYPLPPLRRRPPREHGRRDGRGARAARAVEELPRSPDSCLGVRNPPIGRFGSQQGRTSPIPAEP